VKKQYIPYNKFLKKVKEALMNTPIILDGTAYAKEINEMLIKRVEKVREVSGAVPILATIIVGDDPASVTYVRMKGNACKRAGIESLKIEMPGDTTTSGLIREIEKLNKNENVHGILLQHPVPGGINEIECFNAIDFKKDVDGVTYTSFAKVAMNEMLFGSSTPLGIIRLLEKYGVQIEGKEAVVVGRSPILGKPLAMMLLNKNATVTICHSKTLNIRDIVKRADIVVAAVGKPKFIKADWIKDNAVVVDAGYNPGNIGDTDLENIKERVFAYTPIPGGVGPMTIITLIEQTVMSAEMKFGINQKYLFLKD
jgi:methylenetetrahydrofolate dehydrogenase (NADP+)/methenyltetrahydrofolate cyclohydrolase